MKGAATVSKRIVIGLAAIVQLLFFPVVTFADSPSTGGQETSAPTSSTTSDVTGPDAPTGADADTYTYNDATGLWENEYYTWNPNTKQTKPKTPPTYSYNPETNKWDTTDYRYDAPSGTYVPQIKSTDSNPLGGSPKAPAPTTNSAAPTSGNANSDTQHTGSSKAFNSFYNAAISNNIASQAVSGNSNVSNNTLGANATSGNALAIANVLNILQSSWGMSAGEIATFMADINGDVVGDLLLDPSLLNAEPLALGGAHPSDITVNSSSNSSINNNIDVYASSGSATVTGNTKAEDATSGAATAIANVISLINSHISAGQSFVGNVNINGNLEGDILLPESLQNELIASNVPTTTISPSSLNNGELLAEFNTAHAVATNVDLGAQSGSATVDGNSSAGNATTGSAETNLTVFNLTGRQVIGSNALLVFVNVLGEWVGMIVDAPVGATAAMIGNGITTSQSPGASATIASNDSSVINNNISVEAHSGNAEVSGNTTAGSATSGSASASANVASITNSQFSLADWFGILFINVLGSWHGSFGIDTAMGDTPAPPATTTPPPITDVRVFEVSNDATTGTSTLKPAAANNTFRQTLSSSVDKSEDTQTTEETQKVLSAGVTGEGQGPSSIGGQSAGVIIWPMIVAFTLAALLFAADRALRKRTGPKAAALQRRHSRLVTIRPTFL